MHAKIAYYTTLLRLTPQKRHRVFSYRYAFLLYLITIYNIYPAKFFVVSDTFSAG